MPLPDGTENVLSKHSHSELRTPEIKYCIGCGTESLQKVEYMMMFWTFSLTGPLGVLLVVFSESLHSVQDFNTSPLIRTFTWTLPLSWTIQIYFCFTSSYHKRNKCQFVTAVWSRPLQYSALTAHDN